MTKLLKSSHSDYDRNAIRMILEDQFDQFPKVNRSLCSGTRILLKPNFVAPDTPKNASTTHPEFYLALAELLLDRGCKVTIGESPAFGTTSLCVRKHGVLDECKRLGIPLITFSKTETYEHEHEHKAFQEMTIAAELQDFDVRINLPKLKVHQQMVFTAATKNLYGCITGFRKAYRHFVCENNPALFADMVRKNAEQAKFDLHIADGIEALHVKGPRGGKPYPLGEILMSDSHLALDWYFCQRIGLLPEKAPLFVNCGQAMFDELHALTKHLTEATDFEVAPNFQLSEESPIQFSAKHVVKSLTKRAIRQIKGQNTG